MKVYVYNGHKYKTWYECRQNFPNVTFPIESLLTEELLRKYGVTIGEYQPTEQEKKDSVRTYRNALLQDSDRFVLPDYPIEQVELDSRKQWRQYLRTYTDTPQWWEQNPKTYEEWLKGDGGIYE